MESSFPKGGGGGGGRMDSCPQLLDLIPKDRVWVVRDGGGNGYDVAEERKLQLSLAPPGEDGSQLKQKREESSILSFSLFPKSSKSNTTTLSAGAKRGFTDTLEPESRGYEQQQQKIGFLHFQTTGGIGKESSQKASGMKAEQQEQLSHERMACSKAAAPATPVAAGKAIAHGRSQTRTSPAPVVGWPPIRSFRKNLASSSSKPSPASENVVPEKSKRPEGCAKGMFVKINMDGIPIGRKIDLKAHESYESLSSAVDELFRGLLSAQRGIPASGTLTSNEENPAITGLLDGSGEYTLVYQDNEGDRMLVGDVPWDMFVSTVKRLRVLKSSELSSAFTLGTANRNRTAEPEAGIL